MGEGSEAARKMGVEVERGVGGGGGEGRGPSLVTVETSADTPPGRAAKIISAS